MTCEVEDDRKVGIKNGLRQLSPDQLKRVLDYEGDFCLDTWNYHDGKFCPLAVGVGLDQSFRETPTHEKVYAVLALMGFRVNNTWGRRGEFYTEDRRRDLLTAAREVLEEKLNH